MSHLNALLRPLFDALLLPARGLPPLLSLTILSFVTAIVMLLVVKKTSNQTRLADVKRRIHACLFEIRLFGDDLRAILRAQGEILRHNATYLLLSLQPMLFMIVPFVLVIAELQFHYGYRGLKPGERTIVTVRMKERATERPAVTLTAPSGMTVETPALWIPVRNELAWRLRATDAGDHELQVKLPDGSSVGKSVRVTNRLVRLSPRRVAATFIDELLYPAESPLPAGSGVAAIEVGYPGREIRLLGFSMQWMIPYFVLSIVFAFALRKRFKVTI